MCTNMFVWLLKLLCQTYIAFDQIKLYMTKKKKKSKKKNIYLLIF